MAKKLVAKKQKGKGKGKSFKTVAALIRARFGSSRDYPYEKLLKEVKALRPKSKFGKAQYAWYKSAVKNDRLKGM